jgi:hypothetical protein
MRAQSCRRHLRTRLHAHVYIASACLVAFVWFRIALEGLHFRPAVQGTVTMANVYVLC